jgi:hypothetical protein
MSSDAVAFLRLILLFPLGTKKDYATIICDVTTADVAFKASYI